MIERTYMGVDGRRDHSFRVPRPDLFLATGTPNACTDCHADRSTTWAATEIAKYPAGRQASAVIALLWRAQEQEGWVTEPAVQTVAELLDMPRIRVLEIATFYTMFHLEPVGRIAHIQLCGTTPCWLMGADGIKEVCRRRINAEQHKLSADGTFSWVEVECVGACVNAPVVQIGARRAYRDPQDLRDLGVIISLQVVQEHGHPLHFRQLLHC